MEKFKPNPKRKWTQKFGNLTVERPDPISIIKMKTEFTPTCWLWKGKVANNGYGQFQFRKKWYLVHRFFYETFYGQIDKDKVCRHKCDIRNCINPAHIEIGTQKQNMQDMVNRGRALIGEKGVNAKLTWAQVKEIRSKFVTRKYGCAKLALEYGVYKSTIEKIIYRKTWINED